MIIGILELAAPCYLCIKDDNKGNIFLYFLLHASRTKALRDRRQKVTKKRALKNQLADINELNC